MTAYAKGTDVPVEKTRLELEAIVRRFGAEGMVSGYDGRTAFLAFKAHGRFVRLSLPLPDPSDVAFTHTDVGRRRTPESARSQYEAEARRRWRALALLVKAKLAAVEDGITEFETEFLPHIVLPSGGTVAEHARPGIADAYATGHLPKLLPGGSS